MKFAGTAATQFARKPAPACWSALVFGDDPGVVEDTASELTRQWTPQAAELEIISLDTDAIRRDPALLFDALEAMSLLGGARLIRIRTSGDRLAKPLLDALAGGEEKPDRYAARLLILSAGLQKRSRIRTGYEAASHAAALHVFADTVDDIASFVSSSLNTENVGIDDDALQAFIGDLPGHRSLARAEIEKLVLYAHHLGRNLNMADIQALSATDVDHVLSSVISAILDGKIAEIDTLLDRTLLAGTSPISVLRALQNESQRMMQAHIHMAGSNRNVGMKLRPPVWQSQWQAYSRRLIKWPPSHLARILVRLYETEQTAKSSAALAGPALRTLIINLTRAAAQSKTT